MLVVVYVVMKPLVLVMQVIVFCHGYRGENEAVIVSDTGGKLC